MALPSLLVIIIGFIFIFVIFKLFTTILRAVFYTFVLLFLISIVFGFFVIKDVNDMKNNFGNSSKLVLLADNNTVTSGFTATDVVTPLSAQQLSEATALLQKKDYKTLLGSNYKLFIIKTEVLQNLSEAQFAIEGKKVTMGNILGVLKSDKPRTDYASLIELNPGDIPSQVTNEEIKAGLFRNVFTYIFQRPLIILQQYQKGNIYIYPETIAFKAMKISSIPILDFFVKETINNNESVKKEVK